MTLQQMKYIIMVAVCGNITEAAEKLFIAQPSLTAAIRAVEEELGITAFVRSNKGAEITRDGEILLSYARQIVENTDIMLEIPKNIMVRDRATLFNLLIGLNGFTVCSGVIDNKLNGDNIISRPLVADCSMQIGMVIRKDIKLSGYGRSYVEALFKHLP